MKFMHDYLRNQSQYQLNKLKQQSNHQRLDISSLRKRILLNRITDCNIIKQISISHRFVTTIVLPRLYLEDQAIKYIQNADWLFITTVNLTSNNITKNGVRQLVQCNWKYLKDFKISNNHIGNTGLQYIIKKLDLIHIGITNDGAKLFNKCKWKQLSYLNLSQNHLTQEIFKYFHRLNCDKLDYIFTKQHYHLESDVYSRPNDIRMIDFDIKLMEITAKKIPALQLIEIIQAQYQK